MATDLANDLATDLSAEPAADPTPLLSVQQLVAWYDRSHVVQGLSLQVFPGEIVPGVELLDAQQRGRVGGQVSGQVGGQVIGHQCCPR